MWLILTVQAVGSQSCRVTLRTAPHTRYMVLNHNAALPACLPLPWRRSGVEVPYLVTHNAVGGCCAARVKQVALHVCLLLSICVACASQPAVLTCLPSDQTNLVLASPPHLWPSPHLACSATAAWRCGASRPSPPRALLR